MSHHSYLIIGGGMTAAAAVQGIRELDSNGTGTYAGSDCGHGDGAVADSGDITSWSSSGGVLTISGVALFGGLAPVTIHVPSTHGNYIETISQVFGLPFPGFAVVEVAP